MRKLVAVFVALGVLGLESANAGEALELEGFVRESRAKVMAFALSLKGELQAAIKAGGPGHAITVCSVKAPQIAREISEPPEWTIGRTSHRLRNPQNAPERWEAAVLDEFLERAAKGESVRALEKAELIERDGRETFRFMKAIPVGEICLTCHGSKIDPELKAQIDAIYPEDQATGFSPGELRGAFTITRTAAD